MKYIYELKIVSITITSVLCAILLFNLVRKLRSVLPWRVNCWFCNHNVWIKFPNRNCWTCPSCEQYNGFTGDGDYNKQLFHTNDQSFKTPRVFNRSPPRNGLCKMCNINQQLKVAQLANFVPMNEKRFDEEMELYRLQLEKAYKLCSPCKKVLQMKLHKEKETLLGSKLIESRTPEKKRHKKDKQNELLKNILNRLSIVVVALLFVLVSVDCFKTIIDNENIFRTMNNMKEICAGLLERIISIIKMKAFMTFPSLKNNLQDGFSFLYDLDIMPKILTKTNFSNLNSYYLVNELMQQALGGFACLIQILGYLLNITKMKNAFMTDLLLAVFLITCLAQHSVEMTAMVPSLIKFACISGVLMMYGSSKTKPGASTVILQTPPKKMKNLASSVSSMIDEEDTSALDTDDDVSLSKFGLHNFTDSSNEISPVNSSLNSGRMFTPRTHDSMWTKPKMNSTFCVNSMASKSPRSVTETVFVKPSFNNYQNLMKDDSDSELDESISLLCISSPKKNKRISNSIFSLRKFTATPGFIAPTVASISRNRPLISPSKLGHSASWVAGGYWGSEGERQVFNINGSRSSSQSSGFESQASSLNQRNIPSQPPSREESDCGEPDRASILSDRFQSCNMSSYSYQTPQNFGRVSSAVYPQMQYNGHVHIPQPRFPQQAAPAHNVFGFPQDQYAQKSMFKAPGGSGLIKLPQSSSFSHRN